MIPDRRSHPGSGSSPQRYPGSFLLAFREALARLDWQAERWLGDAVVCRNAAGAEQTVGLEDLYRRVRRENRARWSELIAAFLTGAGSAETVSSGADLETIGDQLMLRIGMALKQESDGPHVWSRALGETGLGVSLVLDDEDVTTSAIAEETIAASGRSEAAWLARAVVNLRERTPAYCFEPIHEESGLLLCAVGDGYDSSRALLVEELLEPPPAGLLLAVPSRDELLVLPLTAASLEQVHLLKVLAERNHRGALHPLSTSVYWVHAGAWYPFPITIRKNEVSIRPPEAFFPMLGVLHPGAQIGGEFDFPPE